jgi:hypothetical protein
LACRKRRTASSGFVSRLRIDDMIRLRASGVTIPFSCRPLPGNAGKQGFESFADFIRVIGQAHERVIGGFDG